MSSSLWKRSKDSSDSLRSRLRRGHGRIRASSEQIQERASRAGQVSPEEVREPTWLSRAVVEAAHAGQVREHGGQLGIRDRGLLDPTLARPRHRWNVAPDSGLARLAASYGFGLIKNHPFLGGNKRIGLVAMNMFLILNGHEIDAPEPQAVDVILAVAEGVLDESGLAEGVRSAMVPYPS